MLKKLFILIGLFIVIALSSVSSVTADSELTPLNQLPIVSLTSVVTYDDVLSQLHTGQWFGWSNSSDKSYVNLLVLDSKYTKPTQLFLDDQVRILQIAYDSRILLRDNLETSRENLETKFLAGTYTDADVVQYLRILGGF
ncbi:hypothetical protein LCGC14_1944530 [marine sediment metagenome]|uniref:Uncharacterized protein n=1 Tax=marine sediment metagenome TaxID=412755 RepID=A0A0F9IGF4_9ZZZZ